MQIRRADKWEGGERYVSYHHDGGRVSVLVEVSGESDPVVLNDICLHIAAFRRATSPSRMFRRKSSQGERDRRRR